MIGAGKKSKNTNAVKLVEKLYIMTKYSGPNFIIDLILLVGALHTKSVD